MLLAGVLLAVLGPAVRADAAAAPSPRSIFVPATFGHTDADDGSVFGTLRSDFFVGDCVARAGSQIQLAPAGVFIEPIWTQFSSTSHTNNADIWHGTFEFMDAALNVLLTVGPLDGLPMSQVNQPYVWIQFDRQVFLSWSLIPTIAWVKWTGSC